MQANQHNASHPSGVLTGVSHQHILVVALASWGILLGLLSVGTIAEHTMDWHSYVLVWAVCFWIATGYQVLALVAHGLGTVQCVRALRAAENRSRHITMLLLHIIGGGAVVSWWLLFIINNLIHG